MSVAFAVIEAVAPGTIGEREQTLAKLDAALANLIKVRSIQEAKHIHDVVKAGRVYAREQKLGREIEHKAWEVTCEALRKLGELLHETKRNTGTRGQLVGPGIIGPSDSEGPIEAPPTLAELGISYKVSWLAQKYFALSPDDFAAVRDGRTTLDRIEAAAKHAADLQAHIELIAQGSDPEAADLRVCSCTELFASGIRPETVIAEAPRRTNNLHLFSELARACVDVPLVAVRMTDPAYMHLPEILDRLREHLTWRGADGHDGLVLVFGQEAALARAKARDILGPSFLRPGGWLEVFVQRFCGAGELVCDPFFQNVAVAITALEFRRRFVGCNPDAGWVADARRQIERPRRLDE